MGIKRIVLFVMTCFQLNLAVAGLSVEQAQEFMHISGLQVAVDSFPEQLKQQTNLKKLMAQDQKDHDKVAAVLDQAITDINTQELMLDYLINRPNADSLVKTIEFLRTDLGKSIVAAESEMNTPEGQMAMQQYTITMSTNPPAQKRIDLIQGLVASLHMEDSMMDMIKSMMFSVVDIMKEMHPGSEVFVKAELEEEWAQLESMFNAQFSQYIITGSHYAYRDLNDKDLELYIDFLKSESGQVYWQASMDIFDLYLKAFIKNVVVKAAEDIT